MHNRRDFSLRHQAASAERPHPLRSEALRFAIAFGCFAAFVIASQILVPGLGVLWLKALYYGAMPTVFIGIAAVSVWLRSPAIAVAPVIYTLISTIAVVGLSGPGRNASSAPHQVPNLPQGVESVLVKSQDGKAIARKIAESGKVGAVFYLQRQTILRVLPTIACGSECGDEVEVPSVSTSRLEYSSQWRPASGLARERLIERIDLRTPTSRVNVATETSYGSRDILYLAPMPVYVLVPSLARALRKPQILTADPPLLRNWLANLGNPTKPERPR